MFENILLWLIIGIAAAYAGRSAYRIFQGKAGGCGCDSSCEEKSAPLPQNVIPDIRDKSKERSDRK